MMLVSSLPRASSMLHPVATPSINPDWILLNSAASHNYVTTGYMRLYGHLYDCNFTPFPEGHTQEWVETVLGRVPVIGTTPFRCGIGNLGEPLSITAHVLDTHRISSPVLGNGWPHSIAANFNYGTGMMTSPRWSGDQHIPWQVTNTQRLGGSVGYIYQGRITPVTNRAVETTTQREIIADTQVSHIDLAPLQRAGHTPIRQLSVAMPDATATLAANITRVTVYTRREIAEIEAVPGGTVNYTFNRPTAITYAEDTESWAPLAPRPLPQRYVGLHDNSGSGVVQPWRATPQHPTLPAPPGITSQSLATSSTAAAASSHTAQPRRILRRVVMDMRVRMEYDEWSPGSNDPSDDDTVTYIHPTAEQAEQIATFVAGIAGGYPSCTANVFRPERPYVSDTAEAGWSTGSSDFAVQSVPTTLAAALEAARPSATSPAIGWGAPPDSEEQSEWGAAATPPAGALPQGTNDNNEEEDLIIVPSDHPGPDDADGPGSWRGIWIQTYTPPPPPTMSNPETPPRPTLMMISAPPVTDAPMTDAGSRPDTPMGQAPATTTAEETLSRAEHAAVSRMAGLIQLPGDVPSPPANIQRLLQCIIDDNTLQPDVLRMPADEPMLPNNQVQPAGALPPPFLPSTDLRIPHYAPDRVFPSV